MATELYRRRHGGATILALLLLFTEGVVFGLGVFVSFGVFTTMLALIN
jgi:succinate-acetate transporter protein